MQTIDEKIAAMRNEMRPLMETAMAGVLENASGMLTGVDREKVQLAAELDEERAAANTDIAAERTENLAEVQAKKDKLSREVAAMKTHTEVTEGDVELNIGGQHFQTTVQVLRRVPHTFFDAHFSGRYAHDVRAESIFIDRDGKHFNHVLEYMRDGNIAVAAPGAEPDVELLRRLKREFAFYSIELSAGQAAELETHEENLFDSLIAKAALRKLPKP
jgi:hypothetical protein